MGQPFKSEIARLFPRDCELRCDAAALGYHALMLGAFALRCHDLLSPPLFVVIVLCAYIRNFNVIHEGSHTRAATWNPLRRFRQAAMIVHGPLQLGRHELARNHRGHHAFPADPERDPGASVNCGRLPAAMLNSFIQSELAFFEYVRREGHVPPSLRRAVAYSSAMTATLIALGGVNFFWWLLATRLGSTAVWFVFDWLLHRPALWSRAQLDNVPHWASVLWAAAFSRDNLNAVRFHGLHHRYPQVADRALPELAAYLAGRAAAEARLEPTLTA